MTTIITIRRRRVENKQYEWTDTGAVIRSCDNDARWSVGTYNNLREMDRGQAVAAGDYHTVRCALARAFNPFRSESTIRRTRRCILHIHNAT